MQTAFTLGRPRCITTPRQIALAARPTAVGGHPSVSAFGNNLIRKADLRRAIRCRALEDDSDDDDEEYEEYEEGYEYEEQDESMRLYLDCADIKVWEKYADTGIFYGYTTNPTILKRDGVQCTIPSMRQLARHAFELEAAELQLQAWGRSSTDLYSCGLDLYEIDSRIVVKLPITVDGLKAARRFTIDGVPFTLTGIYSAHQAVTALSAGATYAAPYLGRMNDAGKDGIEEIIKMQSIVSLSPTEYNGDMRLLVASIRDVNDITTLAAEGCNTFTVSAAIAEQLLNEPLTVKAAEVFQEHADEMGGMRT